jgi:hypothetical protein
VSSGHQARGSDAIDVALLGSGLVLILGGAFFGRISEIDLPGGGGIKLDPVATADVKRKTAAVAGSDSWRQRKLERLTLAELDRDYWGAPAHLEPEEIERYVQRAVDHDKGARSGDDD